MGDRPLYRGLDGEGRITNVSLIHDKVDIDFGPIHIHHITCRMAFKIEGYENPWITLYIKIPEHPGITPYPSFSYLGPTVVLYEYATGIRTFDQMMDIDGWPYFRLSFLAGWDQHKNGTPYTRVIVYFEYPYQRSFSSGPGAIGEIVKRPNHSVVTWDQVRVNMLNSNMSISRPLVEDSVDMKNMKRGTATWTSMGEGGSEGKLVSMDLQHSNIYIIELKSTLLIRIDSDPWIVRYHSVSTWIRSIRVFDTNYCDLMDSRVSISDTRFQVLLEPVNPDQPYGGAIFRYKVEGPGIVNVRVICRVEMSQEHYGGDVESQ